MDKMLPCPWCGAPGFGIYDKGDIKTVFCVSNNCVGNRVSMPFGAWQYLPRMLRGEDSLPEVNRRLREALEVVADVALQALQAES